MMLVDMGRRPRARSHLDSVRAGIGSALRSLHSDVLREPLPDRIAELLRQLDERLRQLDQDDDKA
jgi:Anti-sigma factor NepR